MISCMLGRVDGSNRQQSVITVHISSVSPFSCTAGSTGRCGTSPWATFRIAWISRRAPKGGCSVYICPGSTTGKYVVTQDSEGKYLEHQRRECKNIALGCWSGGIRGVLWGYQQLWCHESSMSPQATCRGAARFRYDFLDISGQSEVTKQSVAGCRNEYIILQREKAFSMLNSSISQRQPTALRSPCTIRGTSCPE
jgi:hypothetical protein